MAKNTKKRAIIYSNVKENKKLAEKRAQIRENQINLSDEVIIGFNSNKKNENNSIPKNNNKYKSNQNNNSRANGERGNRKKYNQSNGNRITSKQEKSVSPHKPKKKKKAKMNPQKKAKVIAITKVLVAIIVVIVALIGFLRSPIFNIKEISIKVDNNLSLTESEIKELSNIAIGQNMFSISKSKSIQNIKTNSYIESVKIKRKIPNKLEIDVVERIVKFQIENNGNYIFVDEYGIVIDQSYEKKEGFVVTGTKTENFINGEKIGAEDLSGLSDVMVIMQEAKNCEIYDDITRIDISNKEDYLIYFDSLGKIAHVGDITSINDKMVRIDKILEKTVDYEGEIFVNVDLNNKKPPYFREKV